MLALSDVNLERSFFCLCIDRTFVLLGLELIASADEKREYIASSELVKSDVLYVGAAQERRNLLIQLH